MREQTTVISPAQLRGLIPDALKPKLDREAERLTEGILETIRTAGDIRLPYGRTVLTVPEQTRSRSERKEALAAAGRQNLSLSELEDGALAVSVFAYQLREEDLLNGAAGMKLKVGKESETAFNYIRRKADRALIEEHEKELVRQMRNYLFLESGTGRQERRPQRGSGRGRRYYAPEGFYWPDQFEIAGLPAERRGLGRVMIQAYLLLTIGLGTKLLHGAAQRFALTEAEEMLTLFDSVGFSTPAHIPDLFPEARRRERHFIIHVGGTNTGKTHDAMEMLAKAPSGVYLCPLRMLAYEGREVIRKLGVPCSFATGEEKEIDPDAHHVSETIGMLDFSHAYDCAVIDECQLISGEDGSLYTNAILGVNADTVCVCCAYSGLDITKRLIELCGDTWEVIEHFRSSELVFEETPYEGPRKNDAYIVFSRIGAYQMAEWLGEQGMNPSIVYGKLPYEVKMEEARKFEDGETDCLVATDAIAIGQNYNIERIVFRDITKFINRKEIRLDSQTVKQVAGRAGRYGRFPVGYVNTFRAEDREEIRTRLDEEDHPSQTAPLELPAFLVEKELPLSLIYRAWTSSESGEPFVKADTTAALFICRLIETNFPSISKEDEYNLASLPLDLRDRYQIEFLESLLNACQKPTSDEEWKFLMPDRDWIAGLVRWRAHLSDLERLCRGLDLASSFFYKIRREDLAEYAIRMKEPVTKKIAAVMAEEIPQEEPQAQKDWPTAYIYMTLSGQSERNTGRFPNGDYSKLPSRRLEMSYGNEASYIDYYCYKKKDRAPDYCRFEPYLRYTVRLDPQFIVADNDTYFLAERFEVVQSDYREAVQPQKKSGARRRTHRGGRRHRRR